MEPLLERVRRLVHHGDVRISQHVYDELSRDRLSAREVVEGISQATIVESYLDYPKGPCILVLQLAEDGTPMHVVWGIPKGESSPAVPVTAYRPDPERWSADFLRRRP
jgi:hypothetical protein